MQKHQTKQVIVKVASVLHPCRMVTACFVLPYNTASLQPLLASDRYESQEVARQKTEQDDFSLLILPCLIHCRTFHLLSPFLTDTAIGGVTCGKSLINGYTIQTNGYSLGHGGLFSRLVLFGTNLTESYPSRR